MNQLSKLFFFSALYIICLSACQSNINPDESGRFIKFFGGAFDDTGFAIKKNATGDFFLVGTNRSGGGRDKIFVAKTDKNGNRIWEHTFENEQIISPSQNPDTLVQSGRDIELLANGNLLVLGSVRSTRPEFADFSRIVLLELNPEGELIESKLFSTVYIRNSEALDLQLLDDGGAMILANTRTEETAATSDMYLLRLDASKQIVFERVYGLLSRNDQIGGITEAANGDFVWTGVSNRKKDPSNADNFFSDMRLTKANQNGNLLWDFAIGENDDFVQSGSSVITLPNGEGFVAVGTSNQNGTEDILLVKTNVNGQIQWQQLIGGPDGQVGGDGNQRGRSVANTEDGGFIITGSTTQANNQDIYLVKTNAQGVVEWKKQFGSIDKADVGQMVLQAIDGGYIIISTVLFENNTVMGLLKTDTQGNIF